MSDLYIKIAREIYAINFNKYQQKDRILLLDKQNNCKIQYVVFLKQQNYILIKVNDYEKITEKYGFDEDQIVNIFSQSEAIDIKNNPFLYQQLFLFNKEQLFNYLVEKIGMQIQQFQTYFKFSTQKVKNYNYKNIEFTIYDNCIQFQQAKYYIDEITKIKYKDLFNKLKINFVTSITEKDSFDVGGNRVKNINGFNNVVNIENKLILKSLFHQLGHIYQQKYINNQQFQGIFNFVLDNQQNISIDGDYIFFEDECIPQLFCNYYYNYNQLNSFTKKFIQDQLLK